MLSKIDFSAIARQNDLSLVLLFGSCARGTAISESDIDIAFLPNGQMSLEEETALDEAFKKYIGSEKVQTVNMHTASPLLLSEILKDGKVLYRSDPTILDAVKSYAYKIIVETKLLRDMRRARLARSI